MGWKGAAVGGYVGSVFGGPLGALFGAVLGHKIEAAAFRRRSPGRRTTHRPYRPDPLTSAYDVLAAHPTDSADELKRKYRALVKKNHPDVLRAGGASEEAVRRATDRMMRINAAWEAVRTARGL